MSWKLFVNQGFRNLTTYTVRITSQEKFFINRSVANRLRLSDQNVAQILFDAQIQKIAIKFIVGNVRHHASYLPIRGLNQKNIYIHPSGFFEFFKLAVPITDTLIPAVLKKNVLTFPFK
jgi:hypothetical protein